MPLYVSGGSTPDTTTNIYVNSVTGSESFNGLYADSAKLYLGTGLSMIDSPTDSVFVSGTFHDSAYTITQGVVRGYSLTSKPIIFGADTLTGFTEVAGTAGDAIVDTFYSETGTDDGFRYASTGFNYGSPYFEIGKHYSSGTGFVRFANIIERAVHDSSKIEFYSYTTNNTGEITLRFYCYNGANPSTFYPLTYAEFDALYATKTTAYKDTTFSNQWDDGTKYIYRCTEPIAEVLSSYTYTGSEAISMFIDGSLTTEGQYRVPSAFDFSSGAEKTKLINYSHGEATPSYYKKYITDYVYDVYFGDTHGTLVENKDSVNGSGDWYYDDANDSLYVYSTSSGVIATLRNGFNVTANATIAGIDFEKCNVGIKTSGTVDTLNLRQNKFYQNVYGLIDSADGTSLVDHNIFSNNINNLYSKNKDTSYIYNNTFYSNFPTDIADNITFNSSKIVFKNNASFTAYPDVITIDAPSNILTWDYNAYGYWNGTKIFMNAGASSYDSLKEFTDSTAFDDNSFDVQSWKSVPYNSIIYWWDDWNWTEQTDFTPRVDTIIVSPLVNAGVYVGNFKDFNGNNQPSTNVPSIGAIEIERISTIDILSAGMFNHTDSALTTFDYVVYETVDSSRIIATNIDGVTEQYITVTDDDSLFWNPEWNTSQTSASISGLYASEYQETDSCKITGWINTGNDTTTYRVSWGISSMTDSGTQYTEFVFVPYEHTVYMEIYSGGSSTPSISAVDTLLHSDSIYFSITIDGLSQDTTYKVRVVANNSAGWTISDTTTFRIVSSGYTPLYTIYMPASHTTTLPDSIGSLSELQAIIDAGDILPGTSIKFEKGGTWTARGGYYGLDLSNCNGTAGNLIVLDSYGTGNKPRFNFTGWADMIDVDGAEYLTIDGLALWNSDSTWSSIPQYGISGYGEDGTHDATEGAHHITITNCLIRNVGGGISLLPTAGGRISDWVISNDTIWGTWNGLDAEGYPGKGTGISLQLQSSTDRIPNVLIDGNVFIDIGAEPNTDNHEHCLYGHEQAMNWDITNNEMFQITRTKMDGLIFAGGSNITISGNTAHDLGFNFVGITAEQVNGGRIDSVYVYNNTAYNVANAVKIARLSIYNTSYINLVQVYNNQFYNLTNRAFQFLLANNVSNLLIANNTVSEYGAYGAVSIEYANVLGTGNYFYNNIFVNTENTHPFISTLGRNESNLSSAFTAWDNNVYYTTSSAPIASIDLGTRVYTTLASWQTAMPFDDNSLNSNPSFIGGGNYHIGVSSPAINAGYDLSATFTTDFDGGTRSDWDIGMDEYGVP